MRLLDEFGISLLDEFGNLLFDEFGAGAIVFNGPIPTLTGNVSAGFSVNLSSYFSASLLPVAYTLVAGTLPGWASLNSSTGIVSGLPNAIALTSGLSVRGTDSGANVANSNSFAINISAAIVSTGPDRIGVPVGIGV